MRVWVERQLSKSRDNRVRSMGAITSALGLTLFLLQLGLDVADEPTPVRENNVLSLGTDLVLLASP